jgi:hypothetical protein
MSLDTLIPHPPKQGTPVTASWGVRVCQLLHALIPRPGPGIRVAHTPNGTIFSVDARPRRGGGGGDTVATPAREFLSPVLSTVAASSPAEPAWSVTTGSVPGWFATGYVGIEMPDGKIVGKNADGQYSADATDWAQPLEGVTEPRSIWLRVTAGAADAPDAGISRVEIILDGETISNTDTTGHWLLGRIQPTGEKQWRVITLNTRNLSCARVSDGWDFWSA